MRQKRQWFRVLCAAGGTGEKLCAVVCTGRLCYGAMLIRVFNYIHRLCITVLTFRTGELCDTLVSTGGGQSYLAFIVVKTRQRVCKKTYSDYYAY